MVNELSEKFTFDELTQMMEKEAGIEPGALGCRKCSFLREYARLCEV